MATFLASWPSTAIFELRVCRVSSDSDLNTGSSRSLICGYFVEHLRADDRRRLVDRLHTLGVGEDDEVERGELPVGAVGHRGIDPRGLLRRRLLGRGGIAAGEDEELVGGQLEAIGLLEAGQRGRALDELGRAGELDLAAARDPFAEVLHAS